MMLRDEKKASELAEGVNDNARGGGKKKKGAKPAKPSKSKAAKVERALAKLSKVGGSDLSPEQAAKNLIKRYDQWQGASATAADVAKASADATKSAEERFRTSVEAGRNVAGSSEEKQRDAIEKLMDIETSWARWQDTIAEQAKLRDDAKKAKKTAWKAVERAIDETRQLPLFS